MKNQIIRLAALCFLLGSCNRVPTNPKNDIPRLKAIDIRFNGGEFDYALQEADKYTKEYPNCDQGWGLLGWSNAKLDQLEPAIICFDRAIKLNPRFDNAYVGLGVVRRKKGDLEGARAAYEEAIRIFPKNAEAFSSLLVIEVLEKNYQKAAEYGEKSWALRQDQPSIPANLAIAYHYLKNEDKKRHFYDEAKRLRYHRLDALDQIFDGTLTIE